MPDSADALERLGFVDLLQAVKAARGWTWDAFYDALPVDPTSGLPPIGKRRLQQIVVDGISEVPREPVLSALHDATGVHAEIWRNAAVRDMGGRLRRDPSLLETMIPDDAKYLGPAEARAIVHLIEIIAALRRPRPRR